MGEKDIVPKENSDLVIRTNNLVRRGLSLLENLEKTELVVEKTTSLSIHATAGQIVQSDESLWIELAPGVKMEFVRVPAGEYLMGSPEDDYNFEKRFRDESPSHLVYLDEYLIGKYPVTNLQYQAFVNAVGCEKPLHWENGEIPQNKQNHPVVNITWHDANAFCLWASKVSSLDIRLPTEAEWEKAARGTNGRSYPWGESINKSFANYDGTDTSKVGSYESGKSPFGAYDMAGNVYEWVVDWYDVYPVGSKNVTLVLGTKYRVLRGGSWASSGSFGRSANRNKYDPSSTSINFGFRCARTSP